MKRAGIFVLGTLAVLAAVSCEKEDDETHGEVAVGAADCADRCDTDAGPVGTGEVRVLGSVTRPGSSDNTDKSGSGGAGAAVGGAGGASARVPVTGIAGSDPFLGSIAGSSVFGVTAGTSGASASPATDPIAGTFAF